MGEELIQAILKMEESNAMGIARERLQGGEPPMNILEDCREAMSLVGDRFERKEFYLPELIVAGEILKQLAELVKPHLKGTETREAALGRVVIGTVAGDIHDIGKDIVGTMLEANKFEVHDLGVDVPAEAFAQKVLEVNPQVVGLSGFLTLAYDQMKATVEAITSAGARDRVTIMIGGAQMDDRVTRYVGADAFGQDAKAAVGLAREWTGVK